MHPPPRADALARAAAILAIAVGLLAGCRGVGSPAGPDPIEAPSGAGVDGLADTRWRLVEFQSMDDAIGVVRPADPAAYTLWLRGDGTTALRLDCNRATGTWSAEPAGDARSGRFAFGPLAATRALCPEPSMGERIARDAPYVRSYLLRGSRLHLSLLADGGIYSWQRESPVAFETRPDRRVEAALRAASPDYTRAMVEIGGREARYAYGRIDLDGDGTPEVLALLMGPLFCGTGGCTLVLLDETDAGHRVVNRFPLARLPVVVSDGPAAGWRDLVRRESGGGAPPSYVRHAFDGTRYVEAERLPGDVTPEGTWVLTGEHTYATGHPLPPREGVPPGDALVEGTRFHATGELPCGRAAGRPLGRCRFGVERRGDGDAEVTVFWPDGGARRVVFAGGVPVASDADAPVRASKESDLHRISIGPERYEIPDAVVFGG